MYLSGGPARSKLLPQTLQQIPGGSAGIRETLKVMKRLAKEGARTPLIRQTAAGLYGGLLQKDSIGEITAIHQFVRDSIRYMRDPVGMENVQTPEATLELKYGDCDDKATLAAALLESTGHPARFVAVGFAPGKFSHVFVETRVHRRHGGYPWIALETTEPWPLGRAPVGYKSRMVQDL